MRRWYDGAVIWLSALMVFGTVGMILANLGAADDELRLGFQQMIHARIPWLLLALLWGGSALGIAAILRKRTGYRFAVLGLELAFTGLISFYFLSFSFLPAHELAVGVGDAFPDYALLDQDGRLHQVDASTQREPALYIFYRGDW